MTDKRLYGSEASQSPEVKVGIVEIYENMEALMSIYATPQETDTEKPIRLLKVSDVARMTQVSPSQVYTMIQEGSLPAIRFGTALRVRPEDLQKFIEVNLTAQG